MEATNKSELDSQFLSLSDIFYCWIEFGTTDHWTVSHGSLSAFIGVLFIYFPPDFSFVRVSHSWASISLRLGYHVDNIFKQDINFLVFKGSFSFKLYTMLLKIICGTIEYFISFAIPNFSIQ